MKGSYIFICFFVFSIHATCLWGQFYSTGEAPASVRWNKISTPHFTVVFPAEIAEEAHKLANELEQYKKLTEEDLRFTVKAFPVVLHSTSVLSNGYVALAPKRMELVSVAPQDAYAQDWITQLVLHEYRHAVQLSKMNQGFTHALSWFTGEIGQSIVSSMIPSWFYEGDAVYNETRLSGAGRGRIPGFEMPLRTILMEHPGLYSYDKAVFGSYRDFVPDHYRYGYQLVNYARSGYGDSIWSQAINYTAKHPYTIWPLAFYLKKNTGFYKSGLYEKTMDSLKIQYNSQEDTITYINYISNYGCQCNGYMNYLLPKDPGDGSVIVLRTGLDDTGSFVRIDSSGREKRLLITGYTTDLDYDLHGSLLVWDEIHPDIRWGRRDYSVLKTLDLKSGKVHALTSGTRYFSPSFSPSGRSIAVAETDLANHNFITLLDAFTGHVLQRIPAPQNTAVQFPEWISDSEIIAVTVSDRGKQLEQLDLRHQTWTVILPHTLNDISEPLNYKQYIMFRGSFKGMENIFAIRRDNPAQLFQVTFSRYGAYHPSLRADSSMILFSSYSVRGFQIAGIPLDTTAWKSLPNIWLCPDPESTTQENSPYITGENPAPITYQPEPYHKINRLFNFHSWVPFYADLEDYTGTLQTLPVNLGFMLFSQNLLSTATSSIGYRYYQGYHEFIPVITWRGWYPVFELSAHLNGPINKGSIRSYVPLVFSKGRYISNVRPQAEYEYSGVYYNEDEERKTGIHYLHFKLYMSHFLRLSPRDIYPRLGQYLTASYTQTLADQDLFGSLFSIQAGLFFPGIARHHHVYCSGGIQGSSPKNTTCPLTAFRFPGDIMNQYPGK